MNRKLPLIAAAAVAALALAAAACHRPRSPEQRAERVVGYIQDELELDDGQTAKLKDASTEVVALATQLAEGREADLAWLTEQLGKDQLDRDGLLALYKKRRDAVDAKAPLLADKLVEFHKSLNNEQKAELVRRLEKHAERHAR